MHQKVASEFCSFLPRTPTEITYSVLSSLIFYLGGCCVMNSILYIIFVQNLSSRKPSPLEG